MPVRLVASAARLPFRFRSNGEQDRRPGEVALTTGHHPPLSWPANAGHPGERKIRVPQDQADLSVYGSLFCAGARALRSPGWPAFAGHDTYLSIPVRLAELDVHVERQRPPLLFAEIGLDAMQQPVREDQELARFGLHVLLRCRPEETEILHPGCPPDELREALTIAAGVAKRGRRAMRTVGRCGDFLRDFEIEDRGEAGR